MTTSAWFSFCGFSINVDICFYIGERPLYLSEVSLIDEILNLTFSDPLAVQSLPGHTSAVESVAFDSTEVFVAAGAASGTVKLWDLEEAKST